jgi:hypothetical protein
VTLAAIARSIGGARGAGRVLVAAVPQPFNTNAHVANSASQGVHLLIMAFDNGPQHWTECQHEGTDSNIRTSESGDRPEHIGIAA